MGIPAPIAQAPLEIVIGQAVRKQLSYVLPFFALFEVVVRLAIEQSNMSADVCSRTYDVAKVVIICQTSKQLPKLFLRKRFQWQQKARQRTRGDQGFLKDLVVTPEAGGEEHEDGHDFQTAYEHEERAEPLDVFGQFAPRHFGAYLGAKRGTDIADAAEGDGDGIGVVDVGSYHQRGRQQHHEGEDGKEGQQCRELRAWHGHTVDLDGQDGIGVQQLVELVAQHLDDHDETDALETSRGAARAGADKHQTAQDDPGDVGPHGGIVVEETCRGEERHNLEER